DAGREAASFVERLHRIVAAMQHQGRNAYAWQQIADIDFVDSPAQAHRIRGRRADAHEIIEPLDLLDSGARDEQRGEDLPERGILQTPTLTHERDQRL